MTIPFSRLFKTTPKGMVKESGAPFDPVMIFSLGWFEGVPLQSDTITDHVSRAKALLIEQFEESENVRALLGTYVKQIQDIEYVTSDVISSRNLSIAFGNGLDIIGERVGESRQFRNDNDYRAAIYFRIFLNSSSGEPETVIEALKVIANANVIHYSEPYPATILLIYQSNFLPPSNLVHQIEQIAPTGIKILLAYTSSLDAIFGFTGEGGFPAFSNVAGFGEINNSGGGKFVELLT